MKTATRLGTVLSIAFVCLFGGHASSFAEEVENSLGEIVATLEEPRDVGEMFLFGNHLFISRVDPILEVHDLSDPESPKPLSKTDLSEPGLFLCVHGDRLWVGYQSKGIDVFSLQNSGEPSLIANIPGYQSICFLSQENDLGAFSEKSGRIVFLDVTDPRQPQRISEYFAGNRVVGACYEEPYLSLALGGLGYQIVDLSYLLGPVFKTLGYPGNMVNSCVSVDGAAVFIDMDGKIVAVDCRPPKFSEKTLAEESEYREFEISPEGKIFLRGRNSISQVVRNATGELELGRSLRGIPVNDAAIGTTLIVLFQKDKGLSVVRLAAEGE